MKTKRLAISLFFTLCSLGSFAQVEVKRPVSYNDMKGTYQIQITDSKNHPVITPELLKDIENKRDKNEVVYLTYSSNIKIMILPIVRIESADFIDVEEYKFIRTQK